MLTRLLAPDAFGLMAIVVILLTGLEMLSDVGIDASLIQNRRGDKLPFVKTAWTIKVLRGILISGVVVALAGPVSQFYGKPELYEILLIIAICPMLDGFSSNAPALATRQLWMGRVTVARLASHLLAICVMIGWAWFSPTVWAIVAGHLVNAAAVMVSSHFIFPKWKAKFGWERECAWEIIHFGKWIFLTSMLIFLAGQIDRLSLAKLVPLDVVGFYSIGFMWAALPVQAVQTWIAKIVFPLSSKVLRETDADREGLRDYRRRLMLVCVMSIALAAVLAEPFFRLIYPETYWPSIEFLTVLLAGSVVRIFDESYRVYNLAADQVKYTTFGSAISILIFAVLLMPCYSAFGAHGIAVAYSLSHVGSLFVSIFGAQKIQLSDLRFDVFVIVLGGASYFLLNVLI